MHRKTIMTIIFMRAHTLFFLKILFIYLTERESTVGRRAEGEGEADSPLSREPDTGLDPRAQEHDLSRRQMLN